MIALLIMLANTGSGSMGADFAAMPAIRVQDWHPFSSLHVGDVVCFKPSKEVAEHYAFFGSYGYRKVVCHRIFTLARDSTGERIAGTWGDNRETNPYPDFGFVNRNNYIGKWSG